MVLLLRFCYLLCREVVVAHLQPLGFQRPVLEASGYNVVAELGLALLIGCIPLLPSITPGDTVADRFELRIGESRWVVLSTRGTRGCGLEYCPNFLR